MTTTEKNTNDIQQYNTALRHLRAAVAVVAVTEERKAFIGQIRPLRLQIHQLRKAAIQAAAR